MKKLLLILVFLTPFNVYGFYAPLIEVKWNVIDFVGVRYWTDSRHHKSDETKYQEFIQGSSEGTFLNCDYQGQTYTYNRYDIDDFLNNKEMYLFKKYKKELKISNDTIFVHRIYCTGTNDALYPFITQKDSKRAYYPFEEGIYVLEYEERGFK